MDESLLDPNVADAEVEQSKEVKMEESKQHSRPLADKEEEEEQEDAGDGDDTDQRNEVEMKDKGNEERPGQFEKSMEDTNKQSLQPLAEKSSDGVQSYAHKEDIVVQNGDGAVQGQKQKESPEAAKNVKAHQIKTFENPMLLGLCGALFPDSNCKSIWRGPHSLVRCQSTSRTSSIRAAIDTLMK